MAYQTVGQSSSAVQDKETIYPKYKDVAAGTVLAEGVFTGSYEGQGQFGAFVTYFVDSGDKKIGLNKAGNLGYLINKAELVPNVSKIRITYLGKEPAAVGPRAGTLMHNFQLEVDNKSA